MPAHAALAPVISAIPDQFTLEDEPILEVPFTVSDPDTTVSQLRFSTLFSFDGRNSSRDNIVITGTGTNRWLSIYPLPNLSGLAQASITVLDPTGLSATAGFRVQVNPVNDPPRLSAIPDQAALRGQGTLSVPFLVSDAETNAASILLTAWSSRQSVVNNAGLRIVQGTFITNRTLQVTLSSTGSVGSTAITIQADDRQGSNTVSFVLNVHPPEFGRSSNSITWTAASFQPVWGDFNGDGLLDLVASTSSIQTNRGKGLFSQGIPLPFGVSASSAAAADYDGDSDLDLLLYGTTTIPRLLRNNGAASPTFSDVSTNWGLLQAYRGPLVWTDMDGDGDLDILGGTNDIRWLRNDGTDGFTDTGTGIPSRTVVGMLAAGDFDNDGDPDVLAHTYSFVTPPNGGPRLYLNDGTGRLTDSQITLPQGLTKAAGWTDIDNDGSLDLWLVQAQSLNLATNSLVVLRQASGRFIEAFRLNDAAPITTIQPVLAPPWADFDNDGDVDFVGRFWSRPTPTGAFTNYPSLYRNNGNGQFATTGLSIAVDTGELLPPAADFDDDGSPDVLYRTGVTSGAWLPMRNQAPSLNPLPGAPLNLHAFVADDIAMLFWNDANDANQASGLTYNVRVGTAPGKNDVVPSMSTTNGARIVPARGNAGNNNWIALNLPLERLNTERLYWSVQAVDNGFQGGPFAPEQTFFIDLPGNLPPSIFGISDLTIPEDTTGNLTLYITDDRTELSALRVQANSSNTNVVSSAGVKLSGFTNTAQGLRVNMSVTPLPDRAGETTITVMATDRGGLTTSRFFVVTVTPVNDPPSVTVAAESLLALAGAATPPLAVSAVDKESPVEQLRLAARSLSPQIVPDANIAITRTAPGWQVIATPVFSGAAQVVIELSVQDPQGAETKRTVTARFQQYLMTSLASEIVSAWPTPFIWADFNRDRKLDLLAGYVAGPGLTAHEVQPGSLPLRARLTPLSTNGVPVDVGDFDNDGDVDVLASTLVNEGELTVSKLVVYRNLGNFAFERVPGAVFDYGAARFADFDRDGRADVCVAEDSTHLVVYRSTGMGSETGRRIDLTTANPPPFASAGSLDIADLDGDGPADLMMIAFTEIGRRQIVYRRQGDTFEQITAGWTSHPIQDLADFDQDQLPDLVTDSSTPFEVKSTWRNLGGLNFSSTGPMFVSWNSRGVVADFDGDGVADILEHGLSISRIHLGRANFAFELLALPFAQADVFISAPADFDDDGSMDFAVSMYAPETLGQPQIAVYRGQSQLRNSIPGNPTDLGASVLSSNAVRLSWNHALDTNQSGGLTYNVRVGTAPGLGDVVSPMSLTDGHRLVPRRGNAGWNTSFVVTTLEPGRTYYWSVQAVDNSFAGGPFAAEASFTMPQAALGLHTVSDSNFELELRAGPDTNWRLEMSSDLKNWLDYAAPGVVLQTTTNGVDRAIIPVSTERQFFRARRVN